MAFIDGLFNNGMKTILQERLVSYPLYVYCFFDILNGDLLVKLDSGNTDNAGQVQYVNQSPRAGKIRPYLRRLLKGKPNVEHTDILFVSRYRPATIDAAQSIRTDYLFHSIINEIFNSPSCPRMALICVGGEGEHYTDEKVDNFGLFDFLSPEIVLKTIFQSVRLYFKYRRIEKKLSRIQKKVFSGFFSLRSLLFCCLFDSCLGKALQYLKPKVLVANDDILIFKPHVSLDSGLIVVQSASITEYSEKNKQTLFSSFLDNAMLSDYFCVSGFRHESLKRRFLRDSRKIVVTGQPRFDRLVNAERFYDEDEIHTELRLIKGKRVLLWTTDTHSLTSEENNENIFAMYQAVNLLKNTQLVIKLHPGEDQQATLYRNDHSYVPIIAKGDQDLYKLLFVCDLMITKSSTSAVEAAIMDKPIIILNLSGTPDIVPYVENGIALGVYRKKDLAPTIEGVLSNAEVREKLARERKKFVNEYSYVQDGRASERVARLIMHAVESRSAR